MDCVTHSSPCCINVKSQYTWHLCRCVYVSIYVCMHVCVYYLLNCVFINSCVQDASIVSCSKKYTCKLHDIALKWTEWILPHVALLFFRPQGEAIWDKPAVVADREEHARALEKRYSGLPQPLLLQVLSYLRTMPDRMLVEGVCRPWLEGARHKTFRRRVRGA